MSNARCGHPCTPLPSGDKHLSGMALFNARADHPCGATPLTKSRPKLGPQSCHLCPTTHMWRNQGKSLHFDFPYVQASKAGFPAIMSQPLVAGIDNRAAMCAWDLIDLVLMNCIAMDRIVTHMLRCAAEALQPTRPVLSLCHSSATMRWPCAYHLILQAKRCLHTATSSKLGDASPDASAGVPSQVAPVRCDLLKWIH